MLFWILEKTSQVARAREKPPSRISIVFCSLRRFFAFASSQHAKVLHIGRRIARSVKGTGATQRGRNVFFRAFGSSGARGGFGDFFLTNVVAVRNLHGAEYSEGNVGAILLQFHLFFNFSQSAAQNSNVFRRHSLALMSAAASLQQLVRTNLSSNVLVEPVEVDATLDDVLAVLLEPLSHAETNSFITAGTLKMAPKTISVSSSSYQQQLVQRQLWLGFAFHFWCSRRPPPRYNSVGFNNAAKTASNHKKANPIL